MYRHRRMVNTYDCKNAMPSSRMKTPKTTISGIIDASIVTEDREANDAGAIITVNPARIVSSVCPQS
jgi:hypothetical protein